MVDNHNQVEITLGYAVAEEVFLALEQALALGCCSRKEQNIRKLIDKLDEYLNT